MSDGQITSSQTTSMIIKDKRVANLLISLNLLLDKGKTCVLHRGLVLLNASGQGLYLGLEIPLLGTKPLNHRLLMLELEVLGLEFFSHVANLLLPLLDSLFLTLELSVLGLELCLHLLGNLILLRKELVLLAKLHLNLIIAEHDIGHVCVHVPNERL